MAILMKKGAKGRERRKVRVRKKVFGTADRPRLNVFRSAKHIYAQVISADGNKVLASASTLDKELRDGATGNIDAASGMLAIATDSVPTPNTIKKIPRI